MNDKRTVADFLQAIRNSAGGKDCVFRGQSDESWPLISGSARRIRKVIGNIDVPPVSMENYHQNLLRNAVRRGFGFLDGRKLEELELLAHLQHFGTATILLDFTENALVALYFACHEKADHENANKNGKIFIVPHRPIQEIQENHPIKSIIESDNPLRWHPILHGAAERRMLTQEGLFLMKMPESWDNHIVINSDEKENILRELEEVYHVSADTLFTDIAGFGKNQSSSADFNDQWTNLYNGNKFYVQREYEKAMECYNKAIEYDSELAMAYSNLALVNNQLRQYEDAIKNCDQAILLLPNMVNSYLTRGFANYSLGKYSESIADLHIVVSADQSNVEAYYYRGMAWARLGHAQAGKTDLEEAMSLAIRFGNVPLQKQIQESARELGISL